jgi:hypothetical protein
LLRQSRDLFNRLDPLAIHRVQELLRAIGWLSKTFDDRNQFGSVHPQQRNLGMIRHSFRLAILNPDRGILIGPWENKTFVDLPAAIAYTQAATEMIHRSGTVPTRF